MAAGGHVGNPIACILMCDKCVVGDKLLKNDTIIAFMNTNFYFFKVKFQIAAILK